MKKSAVTDAPTAAQREAVLVALGQGVGSLINIMVASKLHLTPLKAVLADLVGQGVATETRVDRGAGCSTMFYSLEGRAKRWVALLNGSSIMVNVVMLCEGEGGICGVGQGPEGELWSVGQVLGGTTGDGRTVLYATSYYRID